MRGVRRAATVAVLAGMVVWSTAVPAVAATTTVISQNWAGYTAIGTRSELAHPDSLHAIDGVSAEWVQPAVDCSPRAVRRTGAVSIWAGMDGGLAADGTVVSPTVEQIGTVTTCQRGTPQYAYFWQFAPGPEHLITRGYAPDSAGRLSRLPQLVPGDVISVDIGIDAIDDVLLMNLGIETAPNTWWNVNLSFPPPNAQFRTAECVVEAPTGTTGVRPLPDYGTVQFQPCVVNWGDDEAFAVPLATGTGTDSVTGAILTWPVTENVTVLPDTSQVAQWPGQPYGYENDSFDVTWGSG